MTGNSKKSKNVNYIEYKLFKSVNIIQSIDFL